MAESDVSDPDTVESVKQPVKKLITTSEVISQQDRPNVTSSAKATYFSGRLGNIGETLNCISSTDTSTTTIALASSPNTNADELVQSVLDELQ